MAKMKMERASAPLGKTHEIRGQEKRLESVILCPPGMSAHEIKNLDSESIMNYKRFLKWQRLKGAQYLIDFQRVSKCYRVRYAPVVSVHYSKKFSRAHYGGLIVCGSVWACPVCSSKIAVRRTDELSAAKDSELSKVLVTYTFQHTAQDKLKDLVSDLNKGLRDMKSQREYKELLRHYLIVGSVTSTELTISNLNGWHIHKHTLMYSRSSYKHLPYKILKRRLTALFVRCMAKLGRFVHKYVGVNVLVGETIKESYLSKFGFESTWLDKPDQVRSWSLQNELIKGNFKQSRKEDHYHPFELLDMYLAGNKFAGQKYIEYAVNMLGRRQLVYTRGLRALLGLDPEISDQELAEAQEKDAVLFASLSPAEWTLILRKEKRAEVLEVASLNNKEVFKNYLTTLSTQNKKR